MQVSTKYIHTPVSLSLFFRYKPYYCVRQKDKEKQGFLCISCLNSRSSAINQHLLQVKTFTITYHLTNYINSIADGESFEEANDIKRCKFYSYQKVTESYIGKYVKSDEY